MECDKVTLTGCIFLGLKSFCLAKTLVSLRATDQMWREIIFFTGLDKLRFLHGFLRIIRFYHLPGKYPEADPQDDRGDVNQSMSGCPLLTTVSCQDPCPYKGLQAVFSNPIPTHSHRLTKSQTGRSPEHHKSNERHREKQEKHINKISSLGVPK